MNADEIQKVLAMNADKRAEYHHQSVTANREVWTLIDDDGAVLLVDEELDCVPVWPAEVFVKEWINEDWAHCRPHKISLQDWQQKWLPGLADDDLDIIVFPLQHDGGVVESPLA
ncbi:DUF2750 domain-containing protein [Bowmanella sp. JS7-9]|uniref:DUF2750 domain-containing protein n=2 Tax=Pseudobowmanella zhangzhouensis TaxID=1537679 RepID=A0ABW1XPB0_9ALTE|nr:DUF2750 domain-containing protein [Bowmanella sp. JS7-9]